METGAEGVGHLHGGADFGDIVDAKHGCALLDAPDSGGEVARLAAVHWRIEHESESGFAAGAEEDGEPELDDQMEGDRKSVV